MTRYLVPRSKNRIYRNIKCDFSKKFLNTAMSGSAPKISVGMPVYNGELYLEEAIRSVLRQTYEDFVLYISDNASSDKTEQICRDYASQDKRVSYTRNTENIGASENYNRLFRMVSGPYFRWHNADDICAPELHEKCVSMLDATPEAVLCYGKTKLIDHEGRLIERYEDDLDLRQEKASERFIQFYDSVGLTNVIYGLMRTAAVAKTALMGDSSYPAADTNFMAELVLYGKFIEISEPLFYRRMHREASSWDPEDDGKQGEFWAGKRLEFILPTWKKHMADLKAVRAAPVGKQEKLRLQRYILRSMIQSRQDLLKESWDAIRSQLIRRG